MTKNRGLSLKYKLLLTLTLIPLTMLIVYMLVALNVFKMDKIAYVYESSTSVSKTLSAQASTDLNSVLIIAKPSMQEYLTKNQFGEVSKGIFSVDNPILWLGVFAPHVENPSSFQQVDLIEKDNVSAKIDIDQLPQMNTLLLEALSRGRAIYVPFKDDRVILLERIGDGQSAQTKIFAIMSKLTELSNAFRTPGVTESYLISEQGSILFGPGDLKSDLMSEITGEDFIKGIFEQRFQSGAQGFTNPKAEMMLGSFAKAGFSGTTVITIVPQAEALRAIKVLVIRSVIFMMFLISLTVIISLIASDGMTAALSSLYQATKKVAEGNFDIRVQIKSKDEIGSLADSFNTMASEVSRLLAESADKARMESELKTAQTVQETLFPSPNATIGNLKISGFYEPASECGGDWWHYCIVDEKVFLWIGDATGHGAPAALITSAAKSAATIIETMKVSPSTAMGLLNRAIHDVSRGKIMMTFFIACYDQKTNELSYANASHEAPFLIKKQGSKLTKKDLIPLNDVINPRLGEKRDTTFQESKITLSPGDRVLFYTDGIPDIQNPELQAWGEREFVKGIVSSNADFQPIDKAVTDLVYKFSEFRQGTQLKDDITFFMCQCMEKTL